MFAGRVTSWNMRDKHMAQTLEALIGHLDRDGGRDRPDCGVGAQLPRR